MSAFHPSESATSLFARDRDGSYSYNALQIAWRLYELRALVASSEPAPKGNT